MAIALIAGTPLLALALSATLIFWLALSAFVLASRAYHDLRGWIARWSPAAALGRAPSGRPDAA